MRNLRAAQSGYVLVELIAALTLFSVAGSSLYNGYREGLYCYQRIETSEKIYSGPKLFFIRLEEDLRNMTVLRDFPFQGSAHEISFAALLPQDEQGDHARFRLAAVRYFLEGDELMREEKEIVTTLIKPRPRKQAVLKKVKSLTFNFPYVNEDGERSFRDFWMEDPYAGLPRAVRVEMKTDVLDTAKIVSFPAGVFGVIPEEGGKGSDEK